METHEHFISSVCTEYKQPAAVWRVRHRVTALNKTVTLWRTQSHRVTALNKTLCQTVFRELGESLEDPPVHFWHQPQYVSHLRRRYPHWVQLLKRFLCSLVFSVFVFARSNHRLKLCTPAGRAAQWLLCHCYCGWRTTTTKVSEFRFHYCSYRQWAVMSLKNVMFRTVHWTQSNLRNDKTQTPSSLPHMKY